MEQHKQTQINRLAIETLALKKKPILIWIETAYAALGMISNQLNSKWGLGIRLSVTHTNRTGYNAHVFLPVPLSSSLHAQDSTEGFVGLESIDMMTSCVCSHHRDESQYPTEIILKSRSVQTFCQRN